MTALQRPRSGPSYSLFSLPVVRRLAAAAAALFLVAANAATPETEEMSPARARALLPQETAMIAKGRLRDAERSLSRKISAARKPKDRADLTEAFGIQLFAAAPKLDDASSAMVLAYLERAVDAYRLVLGTEHPEVATALVRRAEVERLIHPADPAPWVDLAYEQAFRIRSDRLGATSTTTLSTLIPMAEMKVLRAQGSVEDIEAAAAMLNQVADATAQQSDNDSAALHKEALERLRGLQALYAAAPAGERRPQIIAQSGLSRCTAAALTDMLIFSGKPAALEKLRGQFRKAGLDPQPCGAMLTLGLGPGVDPSPVLDLLTDISAGRVPGVRIGLSAVEPPEAEAPQP